MWREYRQRHEAETPEHPNGGSGQWVDHYDPDHHCHDWCTVEPLAQCLNRVEADGFEVFQVLVEPGAVWTEQLDYDHRRSRHTATEVRATPNRIAVIARKRQAGALG